MKRFELETKTGYTDFGEEIQEPAMQECADGEYVRHADAQVAIDDLTACLANLLVERDQIAKELRDSAGIAFVCSESRKEALDCLRKYKDSI